MTIGLTALRAEIATTLGNTAAWNVFSYPPPTITANSVIIVPDNPYITPNNNSHASIAPMANFKILMTVPYLDNQANLINMEERIVAIFNKMCEGDVVFNISAASAPAELVTPSGSLLVSEFSISVLTTWS